MKSERRFASEYLAVQLAGKDLSNKRAQELEEALLEDSDEIESRIKLCSYYYYRHLFSRQMRESGFKHVVWFIENSPEHPILDGPEFCMLVQADPDLYETGKNLWLKQLESSSESLSLLHNASSYFALNDKRLAALLIEKLRKLEPDNEFWLIRLSHQYALGLIGELPTEDWIEKAYLVHKELAEKQGDDVAVISQLATTAYKAARFDDAQTAANEVLKMADSSCLDQINDAYSVLGLLKLEEDNLKGAKNMLLKCGAMLEFELPNRLIQLGETEVVCDYLWKNLTGFKAGRIQIVYWIAMLKTGKKPELDRCMLPTYTIGLSDFD